MLKQLRTLSGFTLIELLTALILAAVALSGAVYGYRDWHQRVLLNEHLNLWASTLRFARSYALISGRTTTLCPGTKAIGCNGSDYANGWMIFTEVPLHADGNYDSTDSMVAHAAAWRRSLTLRSNFSIPLQFDALGRANTSGRFVLCTDDGSERMRGIFLIRSGRLRLAQDGELDSCLRS